MSGGLAGAGCFSPVEKGFALDLEALGSKDQSATQRPNRWYF